jgi:hypothetical protein
MYVDSSLDVPPQFLSLKFWLPLKRIFVYPNGEGGTWAGPSYAKLPIPEDLQFITDLLTDLRKSYSVDDQRIYATGLSNGAGFVGILACSAVGNQFAAFAPVAGAFYEGAGGIGEGGCAVGREVVPILEIHGGADRTVAYGGGKGEGGMLPSIPSWYVEYWYSHFLSCVGLTDDISGYHPGNNGIIAHQAPSKTAMGGMCIIHRGLALVFQGACSIGKWIREVRIICPIFSSSSSWWLSSCTDQSND